MLTRDFDSATPVADLAAAEIDQRTTSKMAAPALHALYYSCFPGGGIGRYTHELLRRLQALPGLEVELACLPDFHWRDAGEYPVWAGLREISHPIAWRRRSRFVIGQFVNPVRLFRHARNTQADIVHLSNINHLTFAWWRGLAKPGSVQLVATAHDVRRAKSMLNRAYEDYQLRQFYRRADALFVHSRAQAEELQAFAGVVPERIHQVPHGPYDYGRPAAEPRELRERLGWPQDKQIALFFGNLRDDKNLELLLRSWPRFADSTHLVVAGRGGGRPHQPVGYYRALVADLALTRSVTFLEQYIPDDSVADLFSACDWVALPYSRSFTSQSGVLNVAVCYDRPVLASGAATFTETLEQCDIGVVVPPDDVDALVSGIQTLQNRLASGHPHEFKKYRRLFSWDEAARRTLAVYRTLCGVT